MVRSLFFISAMLGLALPCYSWQESIDGSWGTTGLTMEMTDASGLQLNLSLGVIGMEDFSCDGKLYDAMVTSGIFLPADKGSPDFPSYSKAIAIPDGSSVKVEVLDYRARTYYGITPVPAPDIPVETDDTPLNYEENPEIYGVDKTYPADIVSVSEPFDLRGVDGVFVGVIPFQWNPVSRELTVYTDIKLRVSFEGGKGIFGEDRLRSPRWDRILEGFFVNFQELPDIDYSKRVEIKQTEGTKENAEYIIICPDNPDFIAWADTIARFRTEQGIISEVFTLTEVGGSSYTAIEAFIDNAYNNWMIPPEAFLILGDYPQVISPTWNSYCPSDNIYASVASNGGGDSLPDIAYGRICAQNATHLQNMITKDIFYERTPPTSSVFYNQPTSACGFQTDRWFQVAAETIRGFWANSLGKSPTRAYAICSGAPAPGGSWSSNPNTSTVVNYFHNLGYIELTIPSGITWNATTTDVLNAINSGTFFIQHRDHGSHDGWGQPSFQSSHVSQCTNTGGILPFNNSHNCSTGEYDVNDPCFTEVYHREPNKGFIGVNSASSGSMSFVNDTYVWGFFDYMWPSFMPDYGTAGDPDIRPGFSMPYGKLFLAQSSWPYNPEDKLVTYHLFHHHGDPYMRLYSNVPQTLSVIHSPIIFAGSEIFDVSAPAGSMIAMSVDGVLIGRAVSAGGTTNVSITPQFPPAQIKLVVTKQDYYIYEADITVTSTNSAFVCYAYTQSVTGGHSNGQANPGQVYDATLAVANYGSLNASGVEGYLISTNPNITLDPDTVLFGTVNAGDTVIGASTFGYTLGSGIEDEYLIPVTLTCTDDNDSTWNSTYNITVNAPDMDVLGYYGPAEIIPSDVVEFGPMLKNEGSGTAYSVEMRLRVISGGSYVTLNDSTENLTQLNTEDSADLRGAFNITISSSCPTPYFPEFEFYVQGEGGYVYADTFSLGIGTVFHDSFEEANTWTYTGSNCWHVTTRRSHSAAQSMFSGNETGNYTNSITNARVVSPQFMVGAGSEITFWHYYYTESSWDGCHVQISTDGGSIWSLLTPDEGYTGYSNGYGGFSSGDPVYTGDHQVWEIQHIQIPVSGNINLCWRFGSDGSVSYEGYYFDDFQIPILSGLGVEEQENPVTNPVYTFALMRAYPNPVRGKAFIGYSVGAEVPVRLAVYDISGREVTELVNCIQGQGIYRVEWDSRDNRGCLVSSGTYFYRITAGSFTDANKIVVVR